MSELSVTKITDRVGTGKVNFSQGFKVAGTLDTTLAPTRTEGNTEPATPANGDTWYDTDNDTYDVYINDEWKRFLGAGGAVPSWTVDVSQISYNNVSLNVSGQMVNARDVCLSADGTKMYTVGSLYDAVFQYSLSTAFDLSTASYDSVSYTLTGGVTNPQSIAFNPDGTKMYAVDQSADKVFQYSLSTAFDISTTSYDNVSFSVSSQSNYNTDLFFSTDGTKMYVVNMFSPSEIFQYDLSTGFDLSTASYNSVSYSLTGQPSQPSAVTLNPDGTKMYVIYQGSSNNTSVIRSYSLSTAFDISTASYDNASTSLSITGYPDGMHFSSDGTKIFILFDNSEYVYQYSTGL